MTVTAAAGVLQAAQGGFPMPNSSATSTSVSELVSFGATENSRRFSVSSLLELEDLTPGGIKRGQDADRSEGTSHTSESRPIVLFQPRGHTGKGKCNKTVPVHAMKPYGGVKV